MIQHIKEEHKETLGETKSKVLQFFKLNDRVYEEIYFIGKESDFQEVDRGDSDDGSIDWELSNNYLASMIDVKFAPSIGRSFTLLASCNSNYKIDFWKLDMSKHVDKPKQNSLYALHQPETKSKDAANRSQIMNSMDMSGGKSPRSNDSKPKLLTLETSNYLGSVAGMFPSEGVNLSFNNSSAAGNDVDLKVNEIYI